MHEQIQFYFSCLYNPRHTSVKTIHITS